MIYAKRVRSPLKGGVDVELGPKTVLVGGNGKGKTAVLQALKLGTRGYVDDQEGKDGVTTTAAIARLFPQGAELKAEVEMSDDALFTWASKPRGKGYTKPKATAKERPYRIDYPFHAIRTLLSGDAKKVRAWLEGEVKGKLTKAELLKMLPPTQHDAAKEALKLFDSRSPVELAASLKDKARNMRSGATRSEKTIDGLVQGIPLPLSDGEAETLEERAKALWAQAHRPGLVTPAQHKQLHDSIHSLAERLAEIETQMMALPEPAEDEAATLDFASKAQRLCRDHLTGLGDGMCYVCLRPEASIQEAFGRWGEVLGDMEATASRSRLAAAHAQGMKEIEGMVDRHQSVTVVDSTPVIQEHGDIRARLAEHKNNKRLWQQAEALRLEVATARATADTFSSLATTWLKEGEALLQHRKSAFEDGVSAWLPEGESFAVDVAAGRIGLVRGGEVHTSLSGAETSKVFLALLSSQAGSGSTPSVLDPEDRGWDPDTLAGVMSALTDSPSQVILMSTVAPAEDVEGWTVVPVGD